MSCLVFAQYTRQSHPSLLLQLLLRLLGAKCLCAHFWSSFSVESIGHDCFDGPRSLICNPDHFTNRQAIKPRALYFNALCSSARIISSAASPQSTTFCHSRHGKPVVERFIVERNASAIVENKSADILMNVVMEELGSTSEAKTRCGSRPHPR